MFLSRMFLTRLSSAAMDQFSEDLNQHDTKNQEDVDSQNEIAENEFGAEMVHN